MYYQIWTTISELDSWPCLCRILFQCFVLIEFRLPSCCETNLPTGIYTVNLTSHDFPILRNTPFLINQRGAEPVETRTLTNNGGPGDVSFIVVWKENQLRNEERVVEPDPKHHADAQPAHRVHHEVQSKFHGCRGKKQRKHTHKQMSGYCYSN